MSIEALPPDVLGIIFRYHDPTQNQSEEKTSLRQVSKKWNEVGKLQTEGEIARLHLARLSAIPLWHHVDMSKKFIPLEYIGCFDTLLDKFNQQSIKATSLGLKISTKEPNIVKNYLHMQRKIQLAEYVESIAKTIGKIAAMIPLFLFTTFMNLSVILLQVSLVSFNIYLLATAAFVTYPLLTVSCTVETVFWTSMAAHYLVNVSPILFEFNQALGNYLGDKIGRVSRWLFVKLL